MPTNNSLINKICNTLSCDMRDCFSFRPFGKVISCDDDVFVSLACDWKRTHNVNAYFGERITNCDWVERARGPEFASSLTLVTCPDILLHILKHLGPVVLVTEFAKDFVHTKMCSSGVVV